MRSLVVSHAGKFRTELPHDAIDVALKEPNTILWLDITDPTPEDQILLREEFGFHPLAIEDAVRSHERPKVDAYGVLRDDDGDGVPDAPESPAEPAGQPDLAGAEMSEPSSAAQEPPFVAEDSETTDELAEMVLIPLESLPPAEAR